ncbi:SAGA complex bromodomain subunit Spt7 [Schizosaccharomyces japonicus yFS275]|uniref:SAGA complex bromodomain subunit Spt7 n=1 Tax=Schizosaccharomyces japonicus (strain yFS275 / FY16936) TaxID=402676 RepID=B6K1J8_SCHJY|nr:SAGA complex bromodomain subunit Spt7 [Schizosaccharomyces japonicus yFS275]EEB07819.1 SAGA complex bromodomain subunit Spt7 [Schizosaccharomyces japonicus yFS275]
MIEFYDGKNLQRVTKTLIKNGFWKLYLTEYESSLLEKLASNSECSLLLFENSNVQSAIQTLKNTTVVTEQPTDFDDDAFLFRVRVMLSDYAMSELLYPNQNKERSQNVGFPGFLQSASAQNIIFNGSQGSGNVDQMNADNYDTMFDSKTDFKDPDCQQVNLALIESCSIYHILEDDLVNITETQREITKCNNPHLQQIQNTEETRDTKDYNAGFKFLSAELHSRLHELPKPALELRNILTEVYKTKSKWANDDRPGQEELYTAAERVILDLRNHTKHSSAFLTKVSKRDAPDYYEVIKEPMDLGTMLRKLRGLQYNSKSEIVYDLNLIWNNCLSYNNHPQHPLRTHALSMMAVASKLIPSIPEIIIHERKKENELALDQDPESDEESSPSNKGWSVKRPSTISDEKQQCYSGKFEDHSSQSASSKVSETKEVSPHSEVENVSNLNLNCKRNLLQEKFLKVTTKARQNILHERKQLLDNLRSQEPVAENNVSPQLLILSGLRESVFSSYHPESFSTFAKYVSQLKLNIDVVLRLELLAVPTMPGLDDAFETPASGTPLRTSLSLSRKSGGTIGRIFKNISLMQGIRKLCAKLSAIRQLQITQTYYTSASKSLDHFDICNDGLSLQIPNDFNRQPSFSVYCRSLLRKLCAVLLFHSGFEVFEVAALESFTDISMDYLRKLGMIVSSYSSNYVTAPVSLFLNQALIESGIDDFFMFTKYLNDGLEKNNLKLKDSYKRLQKHLMDLLRPALDSRKDEEKLFSDDRNAFVTGEFSTETGEDFFGLKNLGLADEFGLSNLNIPLSLFQGKLKTNTTWEVEGSSNNDTKSYLLTARFPRITRQNVSKEVGLIKQFLLQQMDSLGANELPEDEDLRPRIRPTRPRLPPSGKVSSSRPRVTLSLYQTNTVKRRKQKGRSVTNG